MAPITDERERGLTAGGDPATMPAAYSQEQNDMTPQTLRRLRRRLKLSQAELARRLKITANSVARWEQGQRAIPPMAEVALKWVEHELKRRRGK